MKINIMDYKHKNCCFFPPTSHTPSLCYSISIFINGQALHLTSLKAIHLCQLIRSCQGGSSLHNQVGAMNSIPTAHLRCPHAHCNDITCTRCNLRESHSGLRQSGKTFSAPGCTQLEKMLIKYIRHHPYLQILNYTFINTFCFHVAPF